jgi:signal transduction histidine kinase
MKLWPDSIKSKQMILAVVLSVVPLLVAGFFAHEIASDTIRHNVENKLRQITLDKAEAINQWMSERRADVVLLSLSDDVRQICENPLNWNAREAFKSFFSTFAEQYGAYSWALIRDLHGEEILLFPETIYTTLLPAFNLDEINDVNVSSAFLMSDQAHFFLSTPVRTEKNQIIGQLTVGVRLEMLNQITDNINIGKTGEAYIVDERGFFLTHQDRSKVLIKDYRNIGIIARLISGVEQDFVGQVIDYRGIPVLGAYYYLPRYKWGLVAEQDVAEAFGPLRRFTEILFSIFLVSVFISGSLASWLTSRNLNPLKQLSETIQQIEEGNLETRFQAKHEDEISQTGKLFNAMLDELEQIRSKLQQKVEASDKNLQKAHTELQKRHEELKQAQERLLHSERLSTMGEIAAGLAHEINNPLSTINMLIFSLQNEIDTTPDERKQIIEIISEEISKIAGMIERFQDLTQPVNIRTEPVVIERVIDRALTLVRPRMEKESVQWSIDVDKNLPVFYGDERHIGQVLLNLLLNSISAMPDGGRVFIRVTSFADKDEKDWISLELSDTGVGISKENLENVFKPFFTTKAEGTGLGLINARKIVEQHGGSITVTSTEGKGTRFTLLFPQEKQ